VASSSRTGSSGDSMSSSSRSGLPLSTKCGTADHVNNVKCVWINVYNDLVLLFTVNIHRFK
jgi:hypothetical protein